MVKITRELRLHYSYPDAVSAKVEQEYYATGGKLPKDFTEFRNRRERLLAEQKQNAGELAGEDSGPSRE